MGRWGYRLFEDDMDLDIACTIMKSLGVNTEKWDHAPIQTVNQTDMLAPQGSREHYKTKDYSKQLQDEIVPSVRAKFDANNLGECLMTKSLAKEGKVDVVTVTTGEYKTIILGALMMRVGAKINEEDLQHLRDLVPKVAKLSSLLPSTLKPRSSHELSCFQCGKIESEIGRKPLQCGKCKRGYYCNQECQKKHWRAHKSICIPPGQRRLLNV